MADQEFVPNIKTALVICNSSYHDHGLQSLHTNKDGEQVEAWLITQGFQVNRLQEVNAKQVEEAYGKLEQDVAKYQPAHKILVFVYYSGRGGLYGSDTVGYGVDACRFNLSNKIRRIRAHENVFIISFLDCSRVVVTDAEAADGVTLSQKSSASEPSPDKLTLGSAATIFAAAPKREAIARASAENHQSLATSSFLEHVQRLPSGAMFPQCIMNWRALSAYAELVLSAHQNVRLIK